MPRTAGERPDGATALSDTYLTVRAADVQTEIQRSRFLCCLRRCGAEQEARDVIAAVRAEHRQANHHCSAFVIGPGGEVRRSNDDGEPSGTAGRPMLEALEQHDVRDVVAVVTRYFGGVKLGTGGLARAYSGAVAQALDEAPRVRRVLLRQCGVTVAHAEAGRVENALREDGLPVRDVTYGEWVTLSVSLADDAVDALRRRLAALHVGEDALQPGALGWQDAG